MIFKSLLLCAAAAGFSALKSGIGDPADPAVLEEPAPPPYSIGTLFDEDDAPWDLESIQSMTWDDLGAAIVDLDGDGLFRFDQKRHSDQLDLDYRQIEVEWGAESDTYSTFSRSGRQPANGTVRLEHRAVVFVPEGYPDRSAKGYGHAVLYNIHEFPRSAKGGVSIRPDEKARALRAVQLFEVPVVLHGEKISNWEQLGYENQDSIYGSSTLAVAMVNSADPKVLKRHYLYALVRQNLQAITLAGRVLDRIEPRSDRGERIAEGVLCRGSSKQAAANLLVAMTGDERVKVLVVGRNHLLSTTGAFKYVEDWGYPHTGDHYPWIDDLGPRSDREKLRKMAGLQLAMAEWTTAAKEGEPGWIFNRIFGIENQSAALGRIDLIAFYGQVGRYKSRQWRGERVGYFSEHDRQFPLGAETDFLERLDPARWRYAREKPDHADPPPRFYTRPDVNWLEAIHQLVEPDRSRWIKIISAESRLKKKKFTVRANVAVGAPHGKDELRLYYTLSERNRCWNDWEQNGRQTAGHPWHPWKSVPMRKLNRGRYEATVTVEDSGWSIAWYVEAMHVVDRSTKPALHAFDCTTPRFERQAPIEPQNRACSDLGAVKIDFCDPESASAGDTVAVSASFTSRRIPIHPERKTFFLELKVDVELMADGAAVDSRRVTLARALEAPNRITLYWEVPQDAAPGDHTLVVAVDPPLASAGRLREIDEENNLSEPIVVKVAPR